MALWGGGGDHVDADLAGFRMALDAHTEGFASNQKHSETGADFTRECAYTHLHVVTSGSGLISLLALLPTEWTTPVSHMMSLSPNI